MEAYIFPIAYAVVVLVLWFMERSGIRAVGGAVAGIGNEVAQVTSSGSTQIFSGLIDELT
jgi:hypothetical protein